MGEKRNFAALDWVIGEISDTLKEARQSLEAYVEDPKDSTRIRFCLTHIHQVLGSLQMVEFHGAALLAEEMEQTAQAIMDNAVASIPEAQEVLMRGLLQLPIYLEHIKTVKEDNPARIVPLLNDLRAVRKQSYLSETNLFSPDLSAAKLLSGDRHAVVSDPEKLKQVLKKLREMYQFAAASVLRGIKIDENLNYLDKVFSRLELISKGTPCYPTWEVSAALVDALKRDDVELTVAVRGLLRFIARELRILGEKAPSALETPPREALLKNLLFYVARADKGSDKVAAVKDKYKLAGALVGGDKSGGGNEKLLQAPDAEAIRSVVVALQDELGSIKRVLDSSLNGDGGTEELKEVLPTVKRVADTLAVLGIGDLRKHMLDQSERLEKISEANSIDEHELMQTASNIVEIEHRLKAIGKSAGTNRDLSQVNEREVEIDNAKATVVKECAAGLQKAKESIIDYISSQWDKQHLVDVGALLTDIRGGLNMIPLHRPAAIVSSCASYIQEQLMDSEEHPSFQTLESLADAMASVEYYLERLMEDLHEEDAGSMLDIAEESVEALGYRVEIRETPVEPIVEEAPASETPVWQQPTVEVEEEYTTAPDHDDKPVLSPAFEAAPVVVEETAPEEAPVDEISIPETPLTALEPEVEEISTPEEEPAEEETVAELEPEPTPEPEPVQAPEPTPEPAPEPVTAVEEEESDIDDEIIEIFIEEAGEVLETLNEYFPMWKAKESDQDSLVIVRRAFHTLKGSGRMVEAFDIGELAWSVENMLNRVIDRTIKATPHVFHVVEAVMAVVPALVIAFENRQSNPQKVLTDKYEAWAHQIAEGNMPDECAEPIPLFEEGAEPVAAEPAAADIAEEPALSVEASIPQPIIDDAEDDQEIDHVLQEIFSQESETHLATLQEFVKHMEEEAPLYSVPTDAMQRALHTLKGSAKMAQVWPIAEITEPLEHFAKELISFQQEINADILQLIKDSVTYIRDAVQLITEGKPVVIPQVPQFIARTQELRDLAVGHLASPREALGRQEHKVDPRMLSLVMAEEMALLLRADQLLIAWQQDGARDDEINSVLDELNTLAEGARQANLNDMAGLCGSLCEAHKKAQAHEIATDETFFSTMHKAHDQLLDMVDAVAAGQNVLSPSAELTQSLDGVLANIIEAPLDLVEDVSSESAESEIEIDLSEAFTAEALAESEADETSESAPEEEITFDMSDFEAGSIEVEADDNLISFEEADKEGLAVEEPSLEITEETQSDDEITFDFSGGEESIELTEGVDETPLFESTEEISFEQDQSTVEAISIDLGEELSASSSVEETSEEINNELNDSDLEDISSGDELEIKFEEDPDAAEISFSSLDSVDDSDAVASLEDILEPVDELHVAEVEPGIEFSEQTSEEPTESLSEELLDLETVDALADELPDVEFDENVELAESQEELESEESPTADVVDESASDESAEQAESEHGASETEESAGNVTHLPGLLDTIDINSDDFDRDILEVFLEEADELVEGMDEAIHKWESNWTDSESLEEIKRILHTLKGGARLSGLNNLGELTHDYETMLIEMGEDLSVIDEAFFPKVHGFQDKILVAVRGVKSFMEGDYVIAHAAPVAEAESAHEPDPAPAATEENEDSVSKPLIEEASSESVEITEEVSADEPAPAASDEKDANVVKFEPKPKPPVPSGDVEFVMPTVGGGAQGQQAVAAANVALKKAGPQEVVKVSAELLEELVNLAGETSINRSRLEQYVNDFGFALDEVDSTLARLQDQLRRLDMETEAQVIFRQEQMEAQDEFDPLEMDRYSHLQQLSRSLMESASDLTDLKSDIGDKLRLTETLLLQQSRINTTLQEGLMRSRMVPFSRMVPRLRRIVRQVASELGKNVSFELDNVEGELDRQVLERMVPPFEHMLRNAVDHGIEMPEDRIAAGKSESGRIVLTLSREGGDVIIRLADDGRGVDLKRVREKAIERELMSADAELSDHDVMQFILHAGFSTAEKVSQISGRGVGMDVVSAEIKQLGGSVTINSAWGKGTEFVIRLPFTLSVNRALMVAIGKDQYAVPLSSIEGIVRVSPFELEHYYANNEAQFEYASENYHVRYLGALLHSGAIANLEGHVLPLPVLLVRSAEHTMALQVDAVMGSREIVVKSLGQQFSTVPGLSGATVMGDGSVVVILDPHALVRQEIARATLQIEEQSADLLPSAEEESRVKTIMVVDDSVTVRKVTTRFLEREGFDVVTAKDGVDALRLLQEGLPDLMLLDIEMPRMDGFEVAKTIRTTKRWEKLPIIMITSRTGDKHREHALSLGVNNYLGKPYQEDILLEAIGEILDNKAEKH